MEQEDSQEDELLQTVRPVHKNNLFPTIPAPVAHVVINLDPLNGKKIILWEDILQAFKDACHPRHGTKILPFLKGPDLKCLDPLRFIAVPNDVVDIVVDGQFTSTDPPPVQSTFDEIKIRGLQYPEYDPVHSILPPTSPHVSRRPSYSSSYSYETPNYRTIPTPAFWNQVRAPTRHTRIPPRQPQPPPSRPPVARPHPPLSPSRPVPPPKPRARMDVKEAFRRIIVHIDLVALQEKGEGTPEEFTKALKCYLKTVCRGHGEAQLSVGELFAQGEDVVQDESRAFEWYLKAAYQGNAIAQRKISRLIFNQPNRSAAAPEVILDSAIEDSSTVSDAISSADTCVASQYSPANIQELPAETRETFAETQDTSVESQKELSGDSHEDVPMATEETPNDTLFSICDEPQTNREQPLQTSNDVIIDLLLDDPHQADEEPVTVLVPRTPTPTANNPRAPQSYGLDDCTLSAPVQNTASIKGPRAPQLNTSSFEQTLVNAEYGDTEAQIRLGLMYMQMEDRDQYEHAVRWFFKAALRGDAEGQRHVGEMFMNGRGVPQDYKAAMYWFKQAADQWNADALFQIGNLYSEGQGVTKSYSLAAVWYTQAANEGSAEAQNRMGFQHEIGLGMPRNQSLALEWYLRAARQGHPGAKENVARLRKGDQPPTKGKKGSFRRAVKKIFS